jgi:hypothetical protein
MSYLDWLRAGSPYHKVLSYLDWLRAGSPYHKVRPTTEGFVKKLAEREMKARWNPWFALSFG